jgi:hypothetical protein
MELTLPSGPFTADQAHALGLPRVVLHTAVAEGLIVRPMRGVYLAAHVEMTVGVRAAAARLVTSPTSVLVDRTAAWLWDVDCFRYAELDGLPPLESCVLRGHQATQRDEVDGVTRDLLPEDWVELGGVRVTTPLRTAADLGCRLWAPHALGAMDALMRAHGFTRHDLQRLLRRYRRRRGVVQLRALVALVDPRAESQPESWIRWFIVEDGLPCPEPQVWAVVDGQRVRLDLAYPRGRILVEYDGEEFHTDPDDREHDRLRRKALRDAGWYVIVVDRTMLSAEARDLWLRELRQVLHERGVLR